MSKNVHASKINEVAIKNEMNFDPPIKPRFYPGEVKQNAYLRDFKDYKKHRLRIVNAQCKVDDKPPRLDPQIFYSPVNLGRDVRAVEDFCKENFELIQRLNKIYRNPSKIDCWNVEYISRGADNRKTLLRAKRETECQNIKLYNRLEALKGKKSEFHPVVMQKRWRFMKETIEAQSRFPTKVEKSPSISDCSLKKFTETNFNNTIKVGKDQRPRCYFDLEIEPDRIPLGRIEFELYTDFAPSICANFEAFCRGCNGFSYKGSPFHSIVSGLLCQLGVESTAGLDCSSIYKSEAAIPAENHSLRHNRPGVLSVVKNEQNSYDSRFVLTFRPIPYLDRKNIVFGKIVKGMRNLFKIESCGSKFGTPLKRVVVSECGVLNSKPLPANKKS